MCYRSKNTTNRSSYQEAQTNTSQSFVYHSVKTGVSVIEILFYEARQDIHIH